MLTAISETGTSADDDGDVRQSACTCHRVSCSPSNLGVFEIVEDDHKNLRVGNSTGYRLIWLVTWAFSDTVSMKFRYNMQNYAGLQVGSQSCIFPRYSISGIFAKVDDI